MTVARVHAGPGAAHAAGAGFAADDLRGRRAVVAGVGDGSIVATLAERGAEVTVIDRLDLDACGPQSVDILVNVVDPAGSLPEACQALSRLVGSMPDGSAVVNVAPDASGVAAASFTAGMLGAARALAREHGPRGVRVNAVAATGSRPDVPAVAGVVAFLAGPGAAGITGECVPAGGPAGGPAGSVAGGVAGGETGRGAPESRLAGAHALVTGGTRGVGRAVSLMLARAGASVMACHRSDDEAAAELVAAPGWDPARCHVVRADLATEEGQAAAIAAARDRFGGLDVLVNNFASYRPAPLGAMTPGELTSSIFDNLTAHMLLTRSALPALRDGGAIVNLGAGMAERGRPGHTAFTAAKAGLAGFARSLAKELAPRRVRVNTVAPGVVETERGLDLPAPVRAEILAAIPLRRFVTSVDVAAAVVFLSDAGACGVTGATVKVDGGI